MQDVRVLLAERAAMKIGEYLFVLHVGHPDNPCRRTELLVVAKSLLVAEVVPLEQSDPRVEFEIQLLRQPDLVVYARLLEYDARAFVDAR